ncbi:MAG TPA: ABC transporter substrate-binding protein [Thermoanaerobaculia bacterium]|jgi:ABC-type glycerol-3-phosphate transport system substrate-binding protein
MSQSRVLIFIGLLSGLAALGCSGDKEVPAVQAPAPSKAVLRVWQTETDKDALRILDEVEKKFEATHPGVDVQIESVAWSSLSSKLTAAIASNNPPDIAHLEPFMVAAVYHRDLLLPLKDVITQIEADNHDRVFATVRELQHFSGEYYGVAYAVGTTGWAYRRDIAQRLGLATPTTWREYVQFARAMASRGGDNARVLLPGGDPFFIDQLVAELLANNGGRLFNPETNRPELNSRNFIEVLEFFRDLRPAIEPGWMTQRYLDQFNRLAHGEAANVPVTYARATRAIKAGAANGLAASPAVFGWMAQPRGPHYAGPPIATIDCEPFVIFRAAASRAAPDNKTNADLARSFLRLFFQREYYLRFVKSVPIHLTPIFEGMAQSPEYLSAPLVTEWKPWHDQTVAFLANPAQTRPILMPDVSPAAKSAPYLLEFQARRILTQAVVDVLESDASPQDAAARAQAAAEQLVESTRR